jgi:hypothetical protein
MPSERTWSWDLAGRLHITIEGLDHEQENKVRSELDPFLPVPTTFEPDMVIGMLNAPDVVELQGPAKDRQLTAVDRQGRLLARFGGHWLEVPAPGEASVQINVQRGLSLGLCWREVIRPAMHQALRGRGSVAVHAAAVDGGGMGGTLLCGWSESGKTEVALAMVENGADFLSDKWTVADPGGEISAFPVSIGVRGWALKALPTLEASLPSKARAQLAASRLLRAAAGPALRYEGGGPVARRATSLLEHAIGLGDRTSLAPSALCRAYQQSADPARRTKLETVVVLVTGSGDRVRVEDATPEWAARRMALAAAYERTHYFNLQERGAYAGLPGRSNSRSEVIAEEQSLLSGVFSAATRVLSVTCPFPGDPRQVVEALTAQSR